MQLLGNEFLAMTVLIFVAVLLLIESAYVFWQSKHGPDARRLRSRMEAAAGRDESPVEMHLLKEGVSSEGALIDRIVRRASWGHALDRTLQQAGLRWTVGRLLLLCVAFGAGTLVAISVALPAAGIVAPAVAIITGAMPLAYVLRSRNNRLRALERQLPEALDLLVRGLRAGHALSATLKMAGDELPDPIGSEFRALHDEVTFGVSLQQALSNLAERVPSTDVRYFVVAVLIQRESGGNLTEILGNLSSLIRERLKLLARVRVLSSEGRLSAWILVIMPFALGGLMTLMNYQFMSRLWTDPIGVGIVKVMLGMMFVGVLMLRKIVRIHV